MSKEQIMERQGARNDLTSSQVETKLRADERVAQESGESRAQVQRYIRLTELAPELQNMVDEGNQIQYRRMAAHMSRLSLQKGKLYEA